MNEDFINVNFIKHFHHHVRSSKERPVLLILDNVDAHISPTAIDLARENSVVMLTIPPHTSHYLQPLDRTCYGPFETAFGVAMDGWMRSHPGRTVTIYDVPSLVAEAQLYSLTIRFIFRMASVSRVYIHITEMSSQMRILRQPKSLIAQIWGLSIVQAT